MLSCECPLCNTEISLQNHREGEFLECPNCDIRLEVVALIPPVLEVSPEEDDDWE